MGSIQQVLASYGATAAPASNGLLTGLVSDFSFNSTVVDGLRSFTGTLSGSYDTSVKKLGSASVSLNGSTNYVDCDGVLSGPVKQDTSVSCWVYLNSAPASREQIAWRGKAGTPTSPWGGSISLEARNIGGTTRLGCWLYAVGADTIYTTDTLSTSTRYHVGLTYNAASDTIKLYLNGVLKVTYDNGGAGAGVNTSDLNGEFQWGRSTDSANNRFHIDANLDQGRIWDRTLSDADMAADYNNGDGLELASLDGIAYVYDSLEAFWALNGTPYDKSINNRHATANNASWVTPAGANQQVDEFTNTTSEWIDTPHNFSTILDGTTDFSICACFRLDSINSHMNEVLQFRGERNLEMRVNTPANTLEFKIYSGTAEYKRTYSISTGTRYSVVCLWDASDTTSGMKISVNESTVSTGAHTAAIATSANDSGIGSFITSSLYQFDGYIANCSVFSKLLDASEITQIQSFNEYYLNF